MCSSNDVYVKLCYTRIICKWICILASWVTAYNLMYIQPIIYCWYPLVYFSA